jgi:predicted hydrocarbon binding protein
MNQETIMGLTIEDHRAAFTEVAFLIDIFTSTIDNIMGGSTSSVGRMAGRDTAKKYPIFLSNPSLQEAVAVVADRMNDGFAIALEDRIPENYETETNGDVSTVVFERCILRDICQQRGIEMGQAMCRLFHSYFDGVINELINRPVKSEITECGKTCRSTVRIQ